MYQLEYASPVRRQDRLLEDVFCGVVGAAYLVGVPAFLILASVVAMGSIGLAAVRGMLRKRN